MKPAEFKNLIDRYLNHEANETERQLIDVWYQSFDGQSQKPDLSAEKEQHIKSDIYNRVKSTWHPFSKQIKLVQVTRYTAAAILCVAAFLGLYRHFAKLNVATQQQYLTIKTSTHEVKKIELPDSSTVWINANSILRISDAFQKQTQRNVYLDEGEAFFKVKRNLNRPFVVVAKLLSTRVLGTSFNVKAYSVLHKATVTVATGRVQVSTPVKVLGIVTPGYQISYARNGSFRIEKSDAGQANSWADGQSVLVQATFDEVALVMRNIYGVQVLSQNKATTHYKYNLHIKTTHTLDETLKIICSVHQNTYKRRKNNEVIIY